MTIRGAQARIFLWAVSGLLVAIVAAPFMGLLLVFSCCADLFQRPLKFAQARTKHWQGVVREMTQQKTDFKRWMKTPAAKTVSEVLSGQFLPGDEVKWIPYHAFGDPEHADCEIGRVTSVSATGSVFVNFRGSTQGCNADQLRLVQRPEV